MELERKYVYIYNELGKTACTKEELETMKIHFRLNIDSERVNERISTIGVLLRILEKRDCLNYRNIESFQHIAHITRRLDIIAVLSTYDAHKTLSSLHAVEATPVRAVKTPQYSYLLTPPDQHQQQVLQDLALDPIARVFDLISSEIGQKWKDFARALQIREGNIDELESKYSSITERVRNILHFHRQNAGEQHWKRKLYDALDKARRKDLRKEVQTIFADHNMI